MAVPGESAVVCPAHGRGTRRSGRRDWQSRPAEEIREGSKSVCSMVPARFLSVLEVEQTEHSKTICKDRLVAGVATPYNSAYYCSLNALSRQQLHEIERFFISYNKVERRRFKPLARRGADSARRSRGRGKQSRSR